jgi:predicted nucleic acid-binding protein
MARVALDADLLIAFLDPGDAQHKRAVDELSSCLTAGDELLLCATVYAEVMVRPLQQRTDATVDGFLEAAGVRFVPTNRTIAHRAAQLRAEHPVLRLPDAMSLATALVSDAKLLTLDKKLNRITQQVQRGADLTPGHIDTAHGSSQQRP